MLKGEVIRLEERLERAEMEGRKLSGTFSSNYENLLKSKSDEIERLKGISEEQMRLINSYDKIVEKEKADGVARAAAANEQLGRMKEEIVDLRNVRDFRRGYWLISVM